MASLKKFNDREVRNQIAHIERTIPNPSNHDIDTSRASMNYSLSPMRDWSSYNYYKRRKSELYVYNRPDIKTLAGWIISAPSELTEEKHQLFFQACYNFLVERYGGEENVISAVVHNDESGQPHLHFLFIPTAEDKKHGGLKVYAKGVLNKEELNNFHPSLQKYLTDNGIDAKIQTGVTKLQGGNKTVKQLKSERSFQNERTRTTSIGRW